MDSGNSGSMQSSSGGDEEYDSRGESVPAFLNPPSHFGGLSNPHPSLLSHHHSHQPTFFDPSSNFLSNPFSQSQPHSNTNPLLNLDLLRRTAQRSEPNCTDLGNLPGSSSSAQSMASLQGINQAPFRSSSQPRQVHEKGTSRSLAPPDQANVLKNPKKRTRASRRAPTTVLTTDTSNFRAMVQEFTGIPAPPFSGSSYSRRLDLFGSPGSALRSSSHLEPMGPLYPLRPAAQKVQSTPPSSSSSSLLNMVDATNIAIAGSGGGSSSATATSVSATTSNSIALTSSSSNYLLPDLGLQQQPVNMLHMQNQNPVLSFQSLLQHHPPSLHQPSLNLSGFGTKSQASLPIHSLDDLGISHGHVNANLGGLQGHVTQDDGARLRSNVSWRDGIGLNDGNPDHLRSFDGNYGSNSQRVNTCKLNYSTASSDFHHEKGLENATTRAEGTVDSWICPSD